MADIIGFPRPDHLTGQHPRILRFLDGVISHGSHEELEDGTYSYKALLSSGEDAWGEILDRFDGDPNTKHIGQGERGVTIDFVQPIEGDISRIEIVPERSD